MSACNNGTGGRATLLWLSGIEMPGSRPLIAARGRQWSPEWTIPIDGWYTVTTSENPIEHFVAR